MERQGEVTQLLLQASGGDHAALDRLFPIVYDELRRIARHRMRHERADHTLSATALVHEAYLKLVQLDRIQWQNRAHFFAVASRAMRNILVSYAVRRGALKRGGSERPLTLDDVPAAATGRSDEILALDEALKRLESLHRRHADVVVCRFFGGMTVEETAEALGVSPATVKRDWDLARAWLNREMSG